MNIPCFSLLALKRICRYCKYVLNCFRGLEQMHGEGNSELLQLVNPVKNSAIQFLGIVGLPISLKKHSWVCFCCFARFEPPKPDKEGFLLVSLKPSPKDQNKRRATQRVTPCLRRFARLSRRQRPRFSQRHGHGSKLNRHWLKNICFCLFSPPLVDFKRI